MKDVAVRRIVDVKNIVFKLKSIVMGKVGVPMPVIGINTSSSEKNHMPKTTEKKIIGTIFFKPISSFPPAIKCSRLSR